MKQRGKWFLIIIAFVVAVFAARLLYLQVYKFDFFREKSRNQLKRIIKLYPNRGTIYDRHLKPLAVTEPSYQIYAVPKKIENNWVFAKKIAPILGKTRKELSDRLYSTKAPFLWLKRHASAAQLQELKALELRGLGVIKTEKRIYANHDLASHVMGFVGVDNQGLSGLEYLYDEDLKGSEGKLIIDGDPRGTQLLSGKKQMIPKNDGQSIVTTIDASLQFVAQQALLKAVQKHQAESGQVVIMDPKTGDILAMAVVPTYNANQWQQSQAGDRRLRPITDMFEPGSIFKIVTLAGALEEDIVSPKTTLHVPETYKLFNKVIKEAHEREPNESSAKTVSEIIEQSLNVGTTLLALKLGEKRFYKYIQDFGFGQRTGIELPGESKGLLRPVETWSGVDIGMLSFGQGIAVTGIQMTAAVAAIANDGMYVKPRIVRYFTDSEQQTRRAVPIQETTRVVSVQTAKKIKKTLENVVKRGTAKNVAIKSYSIAGKTGTAQKPKDNGRGYEPGAYVASFVGFFPVENPQIAMLVAIDSPKKGYYGSTVAGPVFRECAEFIIDQYNIPPDHLKAKSRSKYSKVNSI